MLCVSGAYPVRYVFLHCVIGVHFKCIQCELCVWLYLMRVYVILHYIVTYGTCPYGWSVSWYVFVCGPA